MKEENINKMNLEELSASYQFSKLQQEIGKGFDFEEEFANGFTIEEAKAAMHRRIKLWKWEK